MFSRALVRYKDPEHIPKDAKASCTSQIENMSEIQTITDKVLQTILTSAIGIHIESDLSRENKTQGGEITVSSPVRNRTGGGGGGGDLLTHQNIMGGGESICMQSAWINPFDIH